MKRIRRELEDNEYVRERFLHEGIAASRVSHPSVVPIVEYGTTAHGKPYIIMGHVLGRPLGRLLARRDEVSLARAAEIMAQLLGALAATHARGVVHADVKADNVLVDGDGATTLIDYGLARVVDHPREADRRTVVSGTLEYLAPERLYGAPPTVQSDLFGAGVILYELLTGTRPFRGQSTQEVLACQLAGSPAPPSGLRPSGLIPRTLDQVVARALDIDPRTRMSSAALFRAALEEALGPTTRPTVADALIHGDPDGVIVAYLELAAALVDEHRYVAAANELEYAVHLVTGGAGPEALHVPSALWRLLLLLAGVQDGAGRRSRALYYAKHAFAHATRARSEAGTARCRELLRRVTDARG